MIARQKSRWLVRLSGEEYDLQCLSDFFNRRQLRIYEEGGEWWLDAKRLQSLKDAAVVQARAVELLSWVNGSAQAFFGDLKPVEQSGIVFIDESGTMTNSVFPSGVTAVRLKGFAKKGKARKSTEFPAVENWIAAAAADERVARALWFLALESQEWFTLRRLYELVTEEDGEDWILDRDVAKKDELYQFIETASKYSATTKTPQLRGGSKKKGPISLQDGRKLIFRIVRAWLESRAP